MPRAHSAKNHLTQMGMDPDEIRTAFVDRGVIRLDGAFSNERAARIHSSVWTYAESKIRFQRSERPTWPSGSRSISWKSPDRDHLLAAIAGSPMVQSALDAIFGAGGWKPRQGAQILITMPSQGPWTLNDGWHMDCGFERPTWPVFAVKLFAFLGQVGPRGGGTLLLPGSHRVVERYRASFETPPGSGKQNWLPFMRSNPPLDDLLRGAAMPDLGRELVGKQLDVDGIPVDVVELTGARRRSDHAPAHVPQCVVQHQRRAEVDAPQRGRAPRLVRSGQRSDTMSAPTTLPDEQLLAAWRAVLGAAGSQAIDKMAYGAVCSIATESGARFVLKRVADAIAERLRRFTEEARIVIHLGQRGVPVAVPILSDDGRICVELYGALWALIPVLPLPDDTALPTADSLLQEKSGYYRAVGRAIAEMHVALADCPYDIDRGVIGPDQFAQRWDRLRAELPEVSFAALDRRVAPRWEQIAAALACADPQRLHGDCHGGNILFRDGRVTGILDIDHLPVGPRVYDLAYHLAFHLHWMVRTDVPVRPAVDSMSSATRHLINGYQAVSIVSEDEKAAIAAIALDAALSMVAFWTSIGNVTEEDVWVRTACWIADHEETLHPDATGATM